MPITDLIPWKRREPDREEGGDELQVRQEPFLSFQEQMNRMFDDFFRGSGLEPLGAFREGWDAFSPRVEVVQTDQEIGVSAELPGLEEKDIHVGLSQNVLTISGEKTQEKETKGRNYLRAERSYGSFRRSIPLPGEVDASKADAVFRNGVLTITLPRKVKEQARKRIAIKAK
jgi:HSP20 family protein